MLSMEEDAGECGCLFSIPRHAGPGAVTQRKIQGLTRSKIRCFAPARSSRLSNPLVLIRVIPEGLRRGGRV